MSDSLPPITEENEPASRVATSDAPEAIGGPPDGLEAWWDAIDAELATLPANPELTVSPLQTNDEATVYAVRMTSLGSYPIAAWLSVPAGEGPFPALVTAPSYASVVVPAHVDLRRRFVTMTMKTRGQRGADRPYAAAYPGHLTEGIADPAAWIYRGVMADMLRAYEVLRDHPVVDAERIGITGTDAGLLLNARRPGAAAVQVTAPFWYRLGEMAAGTEAYPYEEINDYLRTYPADRGAVARTLSLVDPRYQAGRVTAAVQINRDRESRFADDAWLAPLVSSLKSGITYFDVTHEGQSDHDANDAWIADRLGEDAVARSWQPEERGPWH
jgi:cephalosporin-C deacetylase